MDWTRGPTIGIGSTATVSLATNTTSANNPFAVKSTELSNSMSLQKEQHLLSKLSCPYVVKYMGHSITNENNKSMYNLYMEYVSGGTLYDLIQRHGGRLEESMIRLCTKDILHGLNYLHNTCGIVHCDIKTQNVLIDHHVAKIADFGCAKFGISTSAFSGTPVFMAPEVARGDVQGFKSDVWSLGCTVIEMVTGCLPWKGLTNNNCIDPVSVLYKIGFSDEIPHIPIRLSEKGKDFISKCLIRDPEERWSVDELLNHPFIDGIDQLESNDQKGLIKSASPSCVLDSSFWDSMESSQIQIQSDQNSRHDNAASAAERVRSLITNVPTWSFEEDWIPVRGSEIDETIGSIEVEESDAMFGQQEGLLLSDSLVFRQELERSMSDENFLFESYVTDGVISVLISESNYSESYDFVSNDHSFEICNNDINLLCSIFFNIQITALGSSIQNQDLFGVIVKY